MEMTTEVGEVAENTAANQLVMLADQMGNMRCWICSTTDIFFAGRAVLWHVIFLLMAIM